MTNEITLFPEVRAAASKPRHCEGTEAISLWHPWASLHPSEQALAAGDDRWQVHRLAADKHPEYSQAPSAIRRTGLNATEITAANVCDRIQLAVQARSAGFANPARAIRS